jgi:hypothetical protein
MAGKFDWSGCQTRFCHSRSIDFYDVRGALVIQATSAEYLMSPMPASGGIQENALFGDFYENLFNHYSCLL